MAVTIILSLRETVFGLVTIPALGKPSNVFVVLPGAYKTVGYHFRFNAVTSISINAPSAASCVMTVVLVGRMVLKY